MHYPQCKDIQSNGEEKRRTEKEDGEKKEGGDYARLAKFLNRP